MCSEISEISDAARSPVNSDSLAVRSNADRLQLDLGHIEEGPQPGGEGQLGSAPRGVIVGALACSNHSYTGKLDDAHVMVRTDCRTAHRAIEYEVMRTAPPLSAERSQAVFRQLQRARTVGDKA